MTRVTHIDSGQVYTTGLLNMRRFEQRPTETLVIGQMLDRTVTIEPTGVRGTVYDVAMEQTRTRDWVLSRVAVQEPGQAPPPPRPDLRRGVARRRRARRAPSRRQGATHLIAALNEMRAADAASVIHDLPTERRTAVVAALDDERLADVLEELPDEDQVEILGLPRQRARRRRARGDVARRRRRPDRRPAARDRGHAAEPDGAPTRPRTCGG